MFAPTVLALGVLGAQTRAELPPPPNPFERAPAQARTDRPRMPLRQLLLTRADVARRVYEARGKEFIAGRGTLKFFLAAGHHLQDARLAVSTSDVERLGYLQEFWQLAWHIDKLNSERYERGRISFKDYMETRFERLAAEVPLAAAWAGRPDPPTRVSSRLVRSLFLDAPEFEGQGLLRMRDVARAAAAAVRADPRQVRLAMRHAAWYEFGPRYKEFIAGRGTLEFLLHAAKRVRDAELALAPTAADRLGHLEGYWLTTTLINLVNEERYQAGRIPIGDLMITRYDRLDAEIALIDARARTDGAEGNPSAPMMYTLFRLWPQEPDPESKLVTRAKYEARHADRNDLLHRRREAARVTHRAQEYEFLNGRGTLDFLLHTTRRLRAADLALAATPAARRAALEQYRDRLAQIEAVHLERYEAKRIPVHDYLDVVYWRLDADIRLAQERSEAIGR